MESVIFSGKYPTEKKLCSAFFTPKCHTSVAGVPLLEQVHIADAVFQEGKKMPILPHRTKFHTIDSQGARNISDTL